MINKMEELEVGQSEPIPTFPPVPPVDQMSDPDFGQLRAPPFYLSWLRVDLRARFELQNIENKHIPSALTDRIAIAHLKIVLEYDKYGKSRKISPNSQPAPQAASVGLAGDKWGWPTSSSSILFIVASCGPLGAF